MPDKPEVKNTERRVTTATAEVAGIGKMTASASMHHAPARYDQDLVRWAAEQAALLRARKFENLDIENLAQEVEDLAKSERRELASRIRRIIEHMLKLAVSPANAPRTDWNDTIRRERVDIGKLLEDSPSLKSEVDNVIHKETSSARKLAADSLKEHGEKPLSPLASVSFSRAEVLPPPPAEPA